jgi:hypothetical protein
MNKSLTIRQKAEVAKINPEFSQGVEWLIIDTSISMNTAVAGTAKTRLQCANEVLNGYGPTIHACSFDSFAQLFKGPRTLYTGGSTSMHLAFEAVRPYKPSYILVMSDGAVDNQEMTIQQATEVANDAVIDTLYIGPDDQRAEAFMKELANIGCGRYRRYDMTKPQTMQLEQVVRALLPAPQHVIES